MLQENIYSERQETRVSCLFSGKLQGTHLRCPTSLDRASRNVTQGVHSFWRSSTRYQSLTCECIYIYIIPLCVCIHNIHIYIHLRIRTTCVYIYILECLGPLNNSCLDLHWITRSHLVQKGGASRKVVAAQTLPILAAKKRQFGKGGIMDDTSHFQIHPSPCAMSPFSISSGDAAVVRRKDN